MNINREVLKALYLKELEILESGKFSKFYTLQKNINTLSVWKEIHSMFGDKDNLPIKNERIFGEYDMNALLDKTEIIMMELKGDIEMDMRTLSDNIEKEKVFLKIGKIHLENHEEAKEFIKQYIKVKIIENILKKQYSIVPEKDDKGQVSFRK